MSLSSNLKAIENKIKDLGGFIETVSDNTVIVEITKDNLKEFAKWLYENNAFLKTCAGVDEREINSRFTLYHIFGLDEMGVDVVVKVSGSDKDYTPTISDIVPPAEWCELEARDMVGIRISGHEDKPKFILPQDWPENVYPLRKDFSYDYRPQSEFSKFDEELPKEVGLPIGPYHPILHEPEYFELYVEGEKVVDVFYRGFHVHRGIEKLAESPRFTYKTIPFLAERICGICGFVHSSCYVLTVEKAAKIEVPERAQFIRSIVLEIERIHSHLLWLGIAAHILGYDAGFMQLWRIREPVMVLAELLTGSRKTYGINIVGGVRRDIDESKKRKALEILRNVRDEFKKVVDVLVSVPEIVKRASGTGVLPKEDARKLSVVGPVARGSGLERDVRKNYPYFAYRYTSFKVPVYSEGDNLARTLVRIDEVFESISIVEQLLDALPKGPIAVESYEIPPFRKAVGAVEAPRGEDLHFIITGLGRPYRWRVRAPTYQNLPALKVMLRGAPLADAFLTIASIDPCFSCTDRAIVIHDIKSDSKKFVNLFYGRRYASR
ncbi:NADH-quinone oxidoreductase subunit C [Ignisphaera sp. 4213-co]|uniref:NADH-quinone oxidoreductase subunit C n=1 Tax=Ignisphaera cupida TaxID=3050454 RepID=A0ABD4Z7M9_9CREN|nr:NADH-quinone oxidoreductase subunit C [Ignisphaera sp. 4213-co]MDK6028578.1 NADH-quinone oxidoreductase subunit C [Ignisphaera sp. 4213-co]